MARPRSEAARARVLEAAFGLMTTGGLANFSIDAVARESGVAKTTIYRHWASGNHLMIEALDSMIAPFPTPNTGDLRSDLRVFFEQVTPIINDPGIAGMMLDILRLSLHDPEIERIHAAIMNERKTPLITVIDLARGRGDISPDAPSSIAVDLIEGAFFARRFLQHEVIDDAAIAEIIELTVAVLENWQASSN